jgi:hypothetical protein
LARDYPAVLQKGGGKDNNEDEEDIRRQIYAAVKFRRTMKGRINIEKILTELTSLIDEDGLETLQEARDRDDEREVQN